MNGIGLSAGLSLLAAGASRKPEPTAEESFGDGELWNLLASGGDVLSGMPIEVAARQDPRRIEALIQQRIVRPLALMVAKMVRPWLSVEALDDQLRHAYMLRNRQLRSSGGVTAESLARADADAWRKNSKILVDVSKHGTQEGVALKALLQQNRGDIRRAFEECGKVLGVSASVDEANSFSWCVLAATVENMSVVINYLSDSSEGEAIDEVVMVLPDGQVPETDRFGALSLDEAASQFGEFEHEQYIVSGHRAPAVALSEYRRMGGRVF